MDKRLGDVIITHETKDKCQQGKEVIKKHIKSKIQGAAIILVLVGQNTIMNGSRQKLNLQ